MKLKLTLAFAVVMAVVLTATGVFLYVRVESGLDQSIDDGLRSRADGVEQVVRSNTSLQPDEGGLLTEQAEAFAQVLDARGRVIDASSNRRVPLLTPAEVARARSDTIIVDHDNVRGVDGGMARLLATPIRSPREEKVGVVGTSLEDRNETLGNLERLLLIGGPIALLLASLAGYGVATAALRPVERMRRRAAEISTAKPGMKLPVPRANDEIGRLGHTLNEMLARLETAFQRERTFVSDASHELRTPLAVLKTELELALGRGRSKQELEAALGSAFEETDRLVQLAEDLLVIARFDQGRLPVRLAPVEVDDVLADVRERFALRSRETQRVLIADAPDGLRLTADPERLRQALANMVDNAFRHGHGTVRVSARASNSHVELHVSDEGPGFPEDFLDAAFERFTRADEGRGRAGTGLGLAIVEAIAHAHRGKAGASNRPEGGADVWLELPADRA
jgi:two-component system OmpR family sensor kinase